MLEELKARNYKSLKDLRLKLGKFNVLIGPNASGKSNIMDCLAFLSGLARRYSLRALLSERGGFDHVTFGGEAEEIQLGISVRINDESFSYEVTITGVEWREVLRGPSGTTSGERLGHNCSSECFSKAPKLAEFMASWAFYSFLTPSMRARRPVRRALRLEPDGSNLAQVLMLSLIHI